MKLLAVVLLSSFAVASFAHGNHDHDDAPAAPPPPKVGSAPSDKTSEPPATPAPAKDEKSKDAEKPAKAP